MVVARSEQVVVLAEWSPFLRDRSRHKVARTCLRSLRGRGCSHTTQMDGAAQNFRHLSGVPCPCLMTWIRTTADGFSRVGRALESRRTRQNELDQIRLAPSPGF